MDKVNQEVQEEVIVENQGEQEIKTYTEEEVNLMLQKESDRRVNQALETFKKNDLPKIILEKQTEAEKLAQMTAEEKSKHEREQFEIKLSARENELTVKELKLEARKMLNDENLPGELLETLNYSSAEDLNNSFKSISQAFNNAVTKTVETQVNDRLRNTTPKLPSNPNENLSFEERLINARKENNTLKIIQIKQEAYKEGKILN